MPSFPALTCGKAALYPLTDGVEFNTKAIRFANDTEQRWNERGGLRNLRLSLSETSGEDISRVRNFWIARLGPRDTWDITLGGETITGLVFVDDDFPQVVSSGNLASVDLAVRQVQA